MAHAPNLLPAKSRTAALAPLTMKLRSVGNPDFGQYASLSPSVTLTVASVEDAAQKARAYIEEWNLGSGNLPKVYVMRGRVKVARIFYNGSTALPGEKWF